MSAVYSLRPTLLASAVMLSLAACDSTTEGKNALVFGPEVQLGNGVARSFIQLEDGKPAEVGVELSEAALTGLPAGGDHVMNEYVVALPTRNPTPFQHIVLNWNPGGHEPPGIYDTPHFDFHFYTIANGARMAIDPADSQYSAKAALFPAADFIPARYVAPAPEAVPMMGVHWIDPASPEFNGQPFTATMIYGSWNGQMIFVEPMITKAMIESKQPYTASISVAARHAVPGYYPSNYQVRFDPASNRHQIVLTALVNSN